MPSNISPKNCLSVHQVPKNETKPEHFLLLEFNKSRSRAGGLCPAIKHNLTVETVFAVAPQPPLSLGRPPRGAVSTTLKTTTPHVLPIHQQELNQRQLNNLAAKSAIKTESSYPLGSTCSAGTQTITVTKYAAMNRITPQGQALKAFTTFNSTPALC